MGANNFAAAELSAWVSGLTEAQLDEVEAVLRYHVPELHSGFFFARYGCRPCTTYPGTGFEEEAQGSGSTRVVKRRGCAMCEGNGVLGPT